MVFYDRKTLKKKTWRNKISQGCRRLIQITNRQKQKQGTDECALRKTRKNANMQFQKITILTPEGRLLEFLMESERRGVGGGGVKKQIFLNILGGFTLKKTSMQDPSGYWCFLEQYNFVPCQAMPVFLVVFSVWRLNTVVQMLIKICPMPLVFLNNLRPWHL